MWEQGSGGRKGHKRQSWVASSLLVGSLVGSGVRTLAERQSSMLRSHTQVPPALGALPEEPHCGGH